MSKEIVTTDTRKRKDKYNAKVARFRPVKNLLLWLSGVVSGLVILAIALVVLPVGTIMGIAGVDVKETIGEENGKKSIYGFVTGIMDMTIEGVPALQGAIGEFTSFIPQFNEFTEVEEGETVDPAASDFVPALYYYKTEKGEFLRAFDNDKNYAQGVNASTKLYYAKLSAVAVMDLPAVLTASFRSMKVTDLIGAVTGDDDMTGSIVKILEDTKVSELGDFDINGIKLSAILTGGKDEEGNDKGVSEQLKNLLCDLAGTKYEEITIGSLTSGFDPSNVRLSSVLTKTDENAFITNLLTEASGGEAYEEITIADFSSLDFTNVKLSTVLGDMDESLDLVKILKDCTGKENFSDITVNDLKTLETNNVKLSSVLQVDGNDKIYEILLSCYVPAEGEEMPTAETLTIGGLSKFNVKKIKLSAVLDLPTAEDDSTKQIYDILLQATGVAGYEDISIESLSFLNTDNIKLATVVKNIDENSVIANVLKDGTKKTFSAITVSDLKTLDPDNIKLSSVLEYNEANKNIFNVLAEGAEVDSENAQDITIGDINDFDVANVKLKTVIPSTNNKILSMLLNDETVTVGNAGTKINELKVSDIYGDDDTKCFTENATGNGKYVKLIGTEKETFVLESVYDSTLHGAKEEGKTYDISPSAGVWFFMFYAREGDAAADGFGVKYVATDIAFGQMESKVNEVSGSVQNATIRELVSCGLVGDPEFMEQDSEKLYAMTLQSMFEMVKAIPR